MRQVDQVNKYSLTGLYDAALSRVRSLRPPPPSNACCHARFTFAQKTHVCMSLFDKVPIHCVSHFLSFLRVAVLRNLILIQTMCLESALASLQSLPYEKRITRLYAHASRAAGA